ncbi:hypothetical protein GTQ38_11665 [Flavobacteriaceae bacterium R33]|uniref:Uncharacterized protein n=2 Tax=Poritiphilus flavus TaxID=2697053 RepID=A0A6L9ED34_9FLAO|nr:hypothetical protein [Poritiphilus flavus]
MVAQDKTVPQVKREREFRIKKSQFPEQAVDFLKEKLENAKKIRFYKEIDSNRTSYEVKFKKDRLKYSVEFSEAGKLEDIEILIREIDLPNESLNQINSYLRQSFKKFRIRKIQQQYVASPGENPEITLKNAFQNLLLPTLNYEFIISGKQEEEYQDYEILFDASGNFLKLRRSLPANYDHVLY